MHPPMNDNTFKEIRQSVDAFLAVCLKEINEQNALAVQTAVFDAVNEHQIPNGDLLIGLASAIALMIYNTPSGKGSPSPSLIVSSLACQILDNLEERKLLDMSANSQASTH